MSESFDEGEQCKDPAIDHVWRVRHPHAGPNRGRACLSSSSRGSGSVQPQTIVSAVGDSSVFDLPVVITNYDYRFRVAEQLREIGAEAAILLEPDRRDSAAAVGAAVAWAAAHDPKTVVAILAADQMFRGRKTIRQALRAGLRGRRRGRNRHLRTSSPTIRAPATVTCEKERGARTQYYCRFSANCGTAGETFIGIALHLTMMEIETRANARSGEIARWPKCLNTRANESLGRGPSGRTQTDQRVAQPDFQTGAGALYRPHRPGLKRRAEALTPPSTGRQGCTCSGLCVNAVGRQRDMKRLRGGLFGWLRSRRSGTIR